MHQDQYILHARGGTLTKVAVEKVLLTGDEREKGFAGGALAMAPDGTIYVGRETLMCKSTDEGPTWTSYKHGLESTSYFQILRDETFISVAHDREDGKYQAGSHLNVSSSTDDGRTWQAISKINLPFGGFQRYGMGGVSLLPGGELLCRVKLYEIEATDKDTLFFYRSTDGGKNWQEPVMVTDYASQGGIVMTPSGSLLTTLRYHGPIVPQWPLIDRPPGNHDYYKTIFLMDSEDLGQTWKNLRQLTNVHGQCYGSPIAFSDSRVVVIHDTRYGPGHRGSRAMVSYAEGKTWADEVYYMTYTMDRAEPSSSVVLKDDLILSIVGSDKVWK